MGIAATTNNIWVCRGDGANHRCRSTSKALAQTQRKVCFCVKALAHEGARFLQGDGATRVTVPNWWSNHQAHKVLQTVRPLINHLSKCHTPFALGTLIALRALSPECPSLYNPPLMESYPFFSSSSETGAVSPLYPAAISIVSLLLVIPWAKRCPCLMKRYKLQVAVVHVEHTNLVLVLVGV